MIKKYINLNLEQEKKVKDLIHECECYDQSILPIQFDHSLNYFSDMNSWFLYFEKEELIAALSIFNPITSIAEISGCIKPNKRQQGKFNELIKNSIIELKAYNINTVLFVIDNDSKSGMSIIEKLNLKNHHTEYLMKYEYIEKNNPTAINIREYNTSDLNDVIRINSELFNETYEESKNILLTCVKATDKKLYVAEINNITIGMCTLFYNKNKVKIYGVGICKKYQGKGYGYNLMNLILDSLKNQNFEIELEVDSTNKTAYNLYKKVGFKVTRSVHYFEKELVH